MCPRAKIEQKHIYNNSQLILSGMFRDDANITSANVAPNICYMARPAYPIQGVEDNQRIGRKITTTSLVIEGNISLFNYNSPVTSAPPSAFETFNEMILDTRATEPLNEPVTNFLKVGVRQFVVEVDPDFVEQDGNEMKRKWLKWFHELCVYVDTSTQVSNSTFVKRESTSYTGQFKILLDKHYVLSQKSPQVHFQYNLNYHRDLNFDGTGSPLPTNKVVYLLTFGPTSVLMDYYNYGFSKYLSINKNEIGTISDNYNVAFVNSNIKLNYLDL